MRINPYTADPALRRSPASQLAELGNHTTFMTIRSFRRGRSRDEGRMPCSSPIPREGNVMSESETTYLRRRATECMLASAGAADPCVRRVHLEFAEIYARRTFESCASMSNNFVRAASRHAPDPSYLPRATAYPRATPNETVGFRVAGAL